MKKWDEFTIPFLGLEPGKYEYEFNDDLFNTHMALYKLSLNNNNKYKYTNITDDIKDVYFYDVIITDEETDKYNKCLLDKKQDIFTQNKESIKDQKIINEKFNKINKTI